MNTEIINDIVTDIREKCDVKDVAQASEIVNLIYGKLIQPFEQQNEVLSRKAKEFAANRTIPFAKRKAETDSEVYNNNLQEGLKNLNRKKKC